jgi:hypothetical protein
MALPGKVGTEQTKKCMWKSRMSITSKGVLYLNVFMCACVGAGAEETTRHHIFPILDENEPYQKNHAHSAQKPKPPIHGLFEKQVLLQTMSSFV